MKKEVLVAILIGFAIGLIITFSIYQVQKTYKQPDQNQEFQATPTPSPSPTTPSHNISIISPSNESVQNESSIVITGTTSPQSFISLVSTDYDTITLANNQGEFSTEFDLESGANLITITSITPTGEKTTSELTIIYSTAEFNSKSYEN